MTTKSSALKLSRGARKILAPWTGKYGGFPPFGKFTIDDIKPAILRGIELKRQEIWVITNQKSLPTFANTIEALEDHGRALDRAATVFNMYAGTDITPAIEELDRELSGLLSTVSDELLLDEALFNRIKYIWSNRSGSGLTAEQERLVDVYYDNFVRNGAELDDEKKARLKQVNESLASLYVQFRQHQLADEKRYLVLETEDDLAGLPDAFRKATAAAATEAGLEGKRIVLSARSSVDPFLASSSRRDLREKVYKMVVSRCDNGDENDNNGVVTQILQLRAELAQILGKESFAHWKLEGNMARHPKAAMDLLMEVWTAAVPYVHKEVAAMQAFADAEGANITIAPWDYSYYAEKVRHATYDIDVNKVKEYLQLDLLRDAMFWAAGKVHGIKMVKLENVPVIHPDVTAYEVRRGRKRIGTFLFDPYRRIGKESGAWMSQARTQERFRKRITPIVTNQCNFLKGNPGEPVLISLDDATTLFHEFGHGLHGLMSNVAYPSLAGTSVKRDWVEFPSQLNELWLMTVEVLKKFALHYVTGEPIPDDLIEKLKKAKTFNMGFDRVEYLASALFDMRVHLAATTDKPIHPGEFERALMAELGCPKEVQMRHRPTHFGHVFGGDGYSAGYVNYIWADAGVADAGEAFEKAGFYDPATCKRLSETIISVGNSVEPEWSFFNFRGRQIDPRALMRKLGFAAPLGG